MLERVFIKDENMMRSRKVPSWLEVPGLMHQILSVTGKERSQGREKCRDVGLRIGEPAMGSRHQWVGQSGPAFPLKVDLRHWFFYTGPSPWHRAGLFCLS